MYGAKRRGLPAMNGPEHARRRKRCKNGPASQRAESWRAGDAGPLNAEVTTRTQTTEDPHMDTKQGLETAPRTFGKQAASDSPSTMS